MLCETCRLTGRPGYIRPPKQTKDRGDEPMIPCPDCGGSGIAHCCDGICEQPAPRPGDASVAVQKSASPLRRD